MAYCHDALGSRLLPLLKTTHYRRLQALSIAAQCASFRKVDTDQVDTISKVADPGKLKDERKWPEWYPAFVNYLSTIPGVYGVPLTYIVRENEAPDHKRDFAGDFTEEIIACAPLDGPISSGC